MSTVAIQQLKPCLKNQPNASMHHMSSPKVACNAIVNSVSNETNSNKTIVMSIVSGANIYYNYTGNTTCLNLTSEDDIGADLWEYQVEHLSCIFSNNKNLNVD